MFFGYGPKCDAEGACGKMYGAFGCFVWSNGETNADGKRKKQFECGTSSGEGG